MEPRGTATMACRFPQAAILPQTSQVLLILAQTGPMRHGVRALRSAYQENRTFFVSHFGYDHPVSHLWVLHMTSESSHTPFPQC
jgi:hypothetical protein